jgi:hypothetical protein
MGFGMKSQFSKPVLSLRSAIAFFFLLASIPLHPAVLSWDDSQDRNTAGFIVYFGRASGVYTDTIDVGRTASYEIKGLTGGTRYYFAVTSYDSCYNESPFSPELTYVCSGVPATVSPDPVPPRILTVQPIGNDMLLVTFDGSVESTTALDTAHYTVDGGLALATHLNSDGDRVLLKTRPCVPGSHVLTVNGIRKEYPSTAAAVDTTVHYRIGFTGVANAPMTGPSTFGLNQNYPNPFNPETRIGFSVMEPGPAVVSVFDLLGKRIRVLFDGEIRTTGSQQDLVWNGTDGAGSPVASGAYLVRLQQGVRTDTRRIQLVR